MARQNVKDDGTGAKRPETSRRERARVLKWASPQLQNTREVVLAAKKLDSNALGRASLQLRNDREVVLTAVKQGRRVTPRRSCRCWRRWRERTPR